MWQALNQIYSPLKSLERILFAKFMTFNGGNFLTTAGLPMLHPGETVALEAGTHFFFLKKNKLALMAGSSEDYLDNYPTHAWDVWFLQV